MQFTVEWWQPWGYFNYGFFRSKRKEKSVDWKALGYFIVGDTSGNEGISYFELNSEINSHLLLKRKWKC